MEYALLLRFYFEDDIWQMVLILIVMEYALLLNETSLANMNEVVLILIVMEYALLPGFFITFANLMSLNPYCNGICSATGRNLKMIFRCICLNPYCNGICSATKITTPLLWKHICLNPYCNGICSATHRKCPRCKNKPVLILIVMEYALLHCSYWDC